MSRCTRGRWKTRTGGETRPRRRQRSHGRATAALQPTTGKRRDLGDVLAAKLANPLHDLLNESAPAARSAPRPTPRATTRRGPILLDTGPGDLTRDPLHDLHRRRVVSWTLTTATGGDQRQRPALSFIGISPRRADTLKEALNKIIKTTEKGHYRRNGNLLNLLLFLRFILLTFLDINISL